MSRREFERALELRETLYAVLRARAHGRRPATGDLDALRDAYVGALSAARLTPSDGALRFVVPPRAGVDTLLLPVLQSALDLLGGHSPLRECPGTDCGWLFVDRTKNGSRRWCSMGSCGAQAKMRRYRAARGPGR